ncbi:site-specific integrase [Mucilaginibacter sp. PAMB04168]|uniref:site-specific integrase n=1 Tax=Mucilaginibacter sp. PAMB04168 TaxID=3138567 RepID=UPI0031F6294E
MDSTIAAILYKSKTLANGKHPIMLRVTKNGKRNYKALNLSCFLKDWDTAKNCPRRSCPDKDKINTIIAKAINEYNQKLWEYKVEGKDFTPDILIAEATQPKKKTTVFKYFDITIENLKKRKEIGNAKVYQDTYNQLKKFSNDKDRTFAQLDYNSLSNFETYLKAKGLTDNALSVRFRTIRALFNSAIINGYTKKEYYPFEKFKIASRYSTKTQKRAITKNDIQEIKKQEYERGSVVYEAQQYFLFSYFVAGMNFMDIARLKWSNILEDRIFYKRAKTGNEMIFQLKQPALEIIKNLSISSKSDRDSYVFPILNKNLHVTPIQQHNRIRKVMSRVNRDLKKIAIDAKIDTPLTTYVARHTFATVLKRSGVSTAIISESMGHQTEAITQTYLKSFENSVLDDALDNLL